MAKTGLVFEDFKDRVGNVLTVSEEGMPPLALTLEQATLLPVRNVPKNARPPFSLIFLGAYPFALPQRLYRLKHENMGEVDIFLVPIGQDERGVSYQAVFN